MEYCFSESQDFQALNLSASPLENLKPNPLGVLSFDNQQYIWELHSSFSC